MRARPAKAALSAEIERLSADYAAACAELRLCREALLKERVARWGLSPPPGGVVTIGGVLVP